MDSENLSGNGKKAEASDDKFSDMPTPCPKDDEGTSVQGQSSQSQEHVDDLGQTSGVHDDDRTQWTHTLFTVVHDQQQAETLSPQLFARFLEANDANVIVFSSKPRKLQPITIMEIVNNNTHNTFGNGIMFSKRILYCSMVTPEPLVQVRADGAGDDGSLVKIVGRTIYFRNFVPGMQLAIRRPKVVMTENMEPVIEVCNYASVEIVSIYDPQKMTTFHCMSSEALTTLAQSEKNPFLAMGLATMAVETAAREEPNGKKYHLALYNRGTLYYNLGYFYKALEDVKKVLEFTPKDAEKLVLKARSLFEMRQYRLAAETLVSVLAQGQGSPLLQFVLVRETQKISEEGVCKLTIETDALKMPGYGFGDYVGEVKIGLEGTSRKPGLFAAKDFHTKDVILVEKGTIFDNEVIYKSPFLCTQLSFFFNLRYRQLKVVPDMKLFKPNVAWEENLETMVFDLHAIDTATNFWLKVGETKLYPLAGFINHSCTPNVVSVDVEGTKIYRAIQQIKSGDEIVVSYVDHFDPGRLRSETLKEKGFHCECERCMMEQEFVNKCPGLEKTYARDKSIPGKVERAMRDRELFPEGLSDEKMSWIRARYFKAYVAYYNAMYKGEYEEEDVPRVLEFMGNFSKYNSGSLGSIFVMINEFELIKRYDSPVDRLEPLKYAFSMVFGDQEVQVFRELQRIISLKGEC